MQQGTVQPKDSESPTQPGPTLTALQQALARALRDQDPGLEVMYVGALHVLNDTHNPDRFALAAHNLRELMEKLPDYVDVEQQKPNGNLNEKVKALGDDWKRAAQNSNCKSENGWNGTIDASLKKFLSCVGKFFDWVAESLPKRMDAFRKAISSFDPAMNELPDALSELSVTAWQRMRDFFVSTSHHRKAPSGGEFEKWRNALENFLIDRLAPRTFEDFDELDALILEAEGIHND